MGPSDFQKVISHAKAYGFIFPSSEIYGQLQAVYDYGPYGVLLKERIKAFWREAMQLTSFRIVALDAAVFMHKKVWEASGHAHAFEDYFVDNLDSKKRYRVDTLAEDFAEQLKQSHQTTTKAEEFLHLFRKSLKESDTEAVQQLFVKYDVKCAESGTSHWGPVRRLKLMFETQIGASTDRSETLYLRPETAQGIYVNFLNIQKSLRLSLPFGVMQIGKAFRNELIARQFVFRMREFEQMEMQFFTSPSQAHHFFASWKKVRMLWYRYLLSSHPLEESDPTSTLHEHTHEHLAHYAKEAVDIEYDFPFGRKEVEGIHNRGDFDLTQHTKVSNKPLQYFDAQTQAHYVPHVIETSTGLDRIVLMILCEAYREETKEDKSRTWLAFSPAFAPVQVAVLPLLRKDGLPEYAKNIYESLRLYFSTLYEEQGSIGKRYARQDLIGTPFCVTIDHQTLTDETLTLRHRDTTHQERLSLEVLRKKLHATCEHTTLLKHFKKEIQHQIPEPQSS